MMSVVIDFLYEKKSIILLILSNLIKTIQNLYSRASEYRARYTYIRECILTNLYELYPPTHMTYLKISWTTAFFKTFSHHVYTM